MPTIETLILRRSYPVPVLLSDLKRAHAAAVPRGVSFKFWSRAHEHVEAVVRNVAPATVKAIREDFAKSLKESTGATDDIFAIIDGHEVRVATVTGSGETATANLFGCISAGQAASVLIAADEAGYWERPHEVRVVLQERPVSVAAVERAVNVGWTAKGGAA